MKQTKFKRLGDPLHILILLFKTWLTGLACWYDQLFNLFAQTSESSHPNTTDNNSETKSQGDLMPTEIKEQERTPSEGKEENNPNVVNC